MTSRLECEVRFSVPFQDLDPMRVVWHGNYLKYFDIAREALFDKAGVDLYQVREENGYVFPITRSSVKHIYPLRHKDEFIVKASIREAYRKIVIDLEVRLVNGGTVCATGRSEQVAVRTADYRLELLIPESIRRALGVEE